MHAPDEPDLFTPESLLVAITKLEALFDVYRKSNQYDQALVCLTRILKLLGMIDPSPDLPDEPLWAITRIAPVASESY